MRNFFILILPLIVFATSSSTHIETDIIERTVNFIIFAFIIYYLLTDRIKVFLNNRNASIQAELEKAQLLTQKMQDELNIALKQKEEMKSFAFNLILEAKSDAKLIKQNIESAGLTQIALMKKNFDERLTLEVRKVKKKIITELLDCVFSENESNISEEAIKNIILRKAAS